jgi:hypothetical protein
LQVQFYDLVNLPRGVAAAARDQLSHIFALAGTEIDWVEALSAGPEAFEVDFSGYSMKKALCAGLPPSACLRIRIIGRSPPGLRAPALGYALPCAKYGIHATIFYNRVEELARASESSLGVILGHVMAHELGHLLLRSEEHSATGVMRKSWTRSDVRAALTGAMSFTAYEAARIREALIGTAISADPSPADRTERRYRKSP